MLTQLYLIIITICAQKITDLQNELEKHKSDESEFNEHKKELIEISNKVLNIS